MEIEKRMRRKMNKKAMFFTILVIALLSLFLVSYTIYSVVQDRSAISKRIQTMNSFLFSLEQDLERQGKIAGFRTIFLAEDYITRTGNYISDIDSFFQEAFFNGTIYGQETEIMVGARYEDILQSVNEKASKINVDITIDEPELSVLQEDPWHVALLFSFNLTMQDSTGLASWSKRENIKSLVKVEGFEDPLYVINTNAKLTNKINKTIYETFVQNGDVSNLSAHAENSYYKASTTAPSFLNRLQGKTQGNENGIESLVYLPKLAQQGISIREKSVVDYIYFSTENPSSQQVTGMPDWFRLDSEHLSIYTG